MRIMRIPIALVLIVTSAAAAEPLFENSGFEHGTLENWTVEGQAFERDPTKGAVVPQSDVTGSVKGGLYKNWKNSKDVYRQPELTGFEGKVFANSYHPERLDKATGCGSRQLYLPLSR